MEMLIMASGGLNSIASTLGYMDGDQYIISDYCEDVLEEMLENLKQENKVTRPVRINIANSKVLESDLLQILAAAGDDIGVFQSALKLLVNLSMPLELILPVHPNMSKTDWQQRQTLQSMLLTIKKHFVQEAPVRAIIEQMSSQLEQHGPYQMDKESVVAMNDCLVLIRNILHIEEKAGVESNIQIVRHMLKSSVGDVIHSMLSREEAEMWISPMVQVIRLMYRDQTSQDLVKQAVKLYEKGTLFLTEDSTEGTGTQQARMDSETADKQLPRKSVWETKTFGPRDSSLFQIPTTGTHVASDSRCDSSCNLLSDVETKSKGGVSSTPDLEQDSGENDRTDHAQSRLAKSFESSESSSGCYLSTDASQDASPSPDVFIWSDASPSSDILPSSDASLSSDSLSGESSGYQESPRVSQGAFTLPVTPSTVLGMEAPLSMEISSLCTAGDAADQKGIKRQMENPCRQRASPTGSSDDRQTYEEDDTCSGASGNGSTFSRSSETGSSEGALSEAGSECSYSPSMPEAGSEKEAREKEEIKNLLCKFAIRFCQHGLNRCVILCQNNLLQHLNDCYVLWCMSYFLPFSSLPCVSYSDVRYNLSSMVVTYLIYITLNTWESFTMATNNASDSKSNILFRRLYLLVASLRQILTTTRRFMEQELEAEEKDSLNNFIKCLCQLEGIRKLFLLLLRKFQSKNESIQYLRALVVSNDELLRIISNKEAYAAKETGLINCEEHVKQLASRQVLLTYNELLQKFNSNTKEENEAVFTLMYHMVMDLNNPKLVFQLPILETFAELWEKGHKECISQSSWNLIDHIVERFAESSKNNPDIFLNQTTANSSKKRMHEDTSEDEYSQLSMKQSSIGQENGIYIHTIHSSDNEEKSVEKQHIKNNIQSCIKALTIKGYKPQIRALQKLLLETCFAKLACPKTEVVEPVVWLNHIQMKSVPLFTYSQAEELAVNDLHFQEVLHHLGMHSAKDSQHLFPSIPAFWTAEMCFSTASMLGEIECDKLKFAMTSEGELCKEYLEIQTPGMTCDPGWPDVNDVEEKPEEERPSTSKSFNRISTLPKNMWLSVVQQLNADKETKT